MDWRLDNSKSVDQEGRKVKPITPQTLSHFIDRKTSRTGPTSLSRRKIFLIPSSFLCFFLFLSLLPSFLPLLFYSFFLPSLFLFFSFPTGETIKPGAVKRPELDPKRGHPNNQDSETNFTLLLQRTCKVGVVNTSTPAGRGNPPAKEPTPDNNRRR